ncbi:hypothetical protein BS47DRAFT_1367348 [Hydnum rufescens UP504]|uniref:Uncharacterized protein n=1 Tax=Hydnum rufescens UP504 TaxID=1448309 RepID=A0A9P6DPN5_9AGAM|nr:hypothetical protein BS47DRAFT_1367348 [Hydnum rufescens UP504]
MYHTPAKADQAWGKTWDHAATHTPILDFGQHIRGRNKYGATHPLLWVYDNTKRAAPAALLALPLYLHCPISDSTNADQVQSKTWDRAAPIPLTLDFPQQRNTKQIWCHTPTSAGYHTIDTARDIPPLKTG